MNMKNLFLLIFILLFSSAFINKEKERPIRLVKHQAFSTGELLEFRVHFGIFNVGRAKMEIHQQVHKINNNPSYKVDIFGWTSGAVGWVTKVDDNWGAYIDSTSLLPHISWRNIKEGRYRKNELVNFDHKANLIEAKVIDNRTGKFKDPVYHQAPENIRDIVGGYLYLRHVDFSQLKAKDTIKMNAFFEDSIYDFRILYMGKERVKTRAGDFNAIKLVPIMPDNKLFAGENSITLWLSDDENRILLKAEANMFIGKAGCELTSYNGLTNKLNYFAK
jgi:hypothetical protein